MCIRDSVEHLNEMGVCLLGDKNQQAAEHRHRQQQNQSDLRIDRHGHDEREDDHDRRAGQQANAHHIGHLHIGDVGGEPRHQAGRSCV